MKNNRVRWMVQTGLFCALVTVCTMLYMPIPATNGYVNLGDSMVMLAGLFFGPWTGAVAGGVGAALADVYLGYAHWALPTLLIKGLEGLLVGLIAYRVLRKNKRFSPRVLVAVGIGGAVMVAGYFTASLMIYGLGVAFGELLPNLMQAAANAVVAVVLFGALFGATGRIRGILSDDAELTDEVDSDRIG